MSNFFLRLILHKWSVGICQSDSHVKRLEEMTVISFWNPYKFLRNGCDYRLAGTWSCNAPVPYDNILSGVIPSFWLLLIWMVLQILTRELSPRFDNLRKTGCPTHFSGHEQSPTSYSTPKLLPQPEIVMYASTANLNCSHPLTWSFDFPMMLIYILLGSDRGFPYKLVTDFHFSFIFSIVLYLLIKVKLLPCLVGNCPYLW